MSNLLLILVDSAYLSLLILLDEPALFDAIDHERKTFKLW